MVLTSKAQINYSFSASTGTYTPLSGAGVVKVTTAPLTTGQFTSPGEDDGFKNNISIGFNFVYNGITYNRVHVCTNGFMVMGTNQNAFAAIAATTAATAIYNSSHDLIGTNKSDTLNRPILAPFWADLATTATNVGISYKTSGTAGSKVFTLEWANVKWDYSAPTGSLSFQVKLYEGTNVIQFIYKRESGDPIFFDAASTNNVAGIGICAVGKGRVNFISLQDSTANPAISKVIEASIAGRPATNQVYTFTPSAAIANDAALTMVYGVPTVATIADAQPISAAITNLGSNTLLNQQVTLTISGANSYTTTAQVDTIYAGKTVFLSFAPVTLSNVGVNTVTISVPSDDDNSNNSSFISQNVTLGTINYASQPLPSAGFGSTNSTIDFGVLFKNTGTKNINNLLLSFAKNPDGPQPVRAAIYDASGVDASGNSPAPGNVLWTSSDTTSPDSTSVTGDFSIPVYPPLTVTGDYFVVVSETDATFSLRYGYEIENPLRLSTFYFQTPTTNGWVDFSRSTVPTVKPRIGVQYDSLPMPVTFVRFSGKKLENKSNQLSWSTATEANNTGFELQRSSNGKTFEDYKFISTKAVNGNSSQLVSYEFTDATPLSGTNYYRLKQIDKNGKFSYSPIVVINSTSTLDIAAIYPNPVKNEMNLKVDATKSGAATVSIIDIAGKVIAKYPVQVSEGNNNFVFQVQMLKSGSYFVKFDANEGVSKSVRFEKN